MSWLSATEPGGVQVQRLTVHMVAPKLQAPRGVAGLTSIYCAFSGQVRCGYRRHVSLTKANSG